MVKIKQNTSVVDVALNLSGSITGLPAVVDQLPVGDRVGFSSEWVGELGPALNMYGDPQYLRNGVDTSNGFSAERRRHIKRILRVRRSGLAV